VCKQPEVAVVREGELWPYAGRPLRGGTVYAGGDFATIGGTARNHIAALDTANGDAAGWDPNADGPVFTLLISGANILVGGDFDVIGGRARGNLATLTLSGGNATNWNPAADSTVYVLAVKDGLVGGPVRFRTLFRQSGMSWCVSLPSRAGCCMSR